ncbi:site-specific integrase [Chryseobacterium sp. POL2]|uniref:site-specific integrase n=1 Tax=Chryseobacterium sp. POL2 TaxID=2713414 RepID=UPI0013E1CBAA|nr:site-specific integrase [Chryseobacterium sp. POL2]QIG88497.1 site-specific integrase [Chryseobacterium sp. POL2]QIG88584.1 site-specific integrase [Chryseobacterium sp. POL2]
MATVKLILRTFQEDKNGECPLYIRVIKDRKAKFISTGYKFKPSQWDEEKQRVKKIYKSSARVNAFLAQKVADAEGQVADMERQTKSVSARKLKEAIKGKSSLNYFDYSYNRCEKIKSTVSLKTYVCYKGVLDKLKRFNQNRDLNFDDMTVTFLKDYVNYCSSKLGNSNTTIKHSLIIMGQFFKDAINEDLVYANLYNFNKISIKKEPSKRMYLNKKQIEDFKNLEVNQDSKAPVIKDMFLFSIYAGGLRLSDVLELKWSNINLDENRIIKTIKKTGRQHSFKFGQSALDVLTKYHSKTSEEDDFVFPMLDKETPYFTNRNFALAEMARCTSLSSLHLRNMEKAMKLPFRLSFHISRHTFATNALNNGMRIEHVSKLLDHSDIGITQIYAKVISEELDKAVEQYIN